MQGRIKESGKSGNQENQARNPNSNAAEIKESGESEESGQKTRSKRRGESVNQGNRHWLIFERDFFFLEQPLHKCHISVTKLCPTKKPFTQSSSTIHEAFRPSIGGPNAALNRSVCTSHTFAEATPSGLAMEQQKQL